MSRSGPSLAIPFVKALVISGDRRRFLLQLRDKPDDRYRGFWELPGGRVEEGESLLPALARELEEEVSLRLDVVLGQRGDRLVDRFGGSARRVEPLVTIEVQGAGRPIFGHYFACLASGEIRATGEAREHRWIEPREFAERFLSPSGHPPLVARCGVEEECSTVDLLAMRILLREGALSPLFRRQSTRIEP